MRVWKDQIQENIYKWYKWKYNDVLNTYHYVYQLQILRIKQQTILSSHPPFRTGIQNFNASNRVSDSLSRKFEKKYMQSGTELKLKSIFTFLFYILF